MSETVPSYRERALAWVEKTLRERNEPEGAWRRFLRRAGALLSFASVAYFIVLAAFLVVLQWKGERNWFLSLFLYAPPLAWLLPLAALTPLCLVFRPRLCWWHIGAVVFVVFLFMDFRWSRPVEAGEQSLTVVSNNIGQRKTRTLFPLVEAENPDIIALQDASLYQGKALRLGEENLAVARQGPFVLISRFPILDSGIVPELRHRRRPVAAWFEIDYDGETVVIYNIHLPTPRPDFMKIRGHGFLAEAARRGGIYSEETRKEYSDAMASRVQLARDLAAVLAQEQRPSLALGDFNAPDCGYVYRLFGSQMTDAFVARGRGYGLTFPGVSRNPLSLFGPWLRIDYIFANQAFEVLDCYVEPRQDAQHRAVIARFEMKRMPPAAAGNRPDQTNRRTTGSRLAARE